MGPNQKSLNCTFDNIDINFEMINFEILTTVILKKKPNTKLVRGQTISKYNNHLPQLFAPHQFSCTFSQIFSDVSDLYSYYYLPYGHI